MPSPLTNGQALPRAARLGLFLLGAVFIAAAFAGWFAAPVGVPLAAVWGLAAGLAAGIFLPRALKLIEKTSPVKLLILALAVTLATRAAWLLATRTEPIMDFERMYSAAAALADGSPLPQARYISMFPHTLGYPMFLSVLFRVTGPSVLAAQGFNLVLSLVCAALIFFIARRACGNAAGFLAATVWALLPSQIIQTSLVCNELLHLTLMLASIAIFTRLSGEKDRHAARVLADWAALGAAVGFSSMVRPVGPVLLIAFALCFLAFSPSPFRFKLTRLNLQKLLPLAAMTLAFWIVTSLFSLWADAALEQKSTSSMGWNLYVGMNYERHGAWSAADHELMAARMESGMTAAGIQEDFLRDGLSRLSENARGGRLIPLALDKFTRIWSHDYVTAEWLSQSAGASSPLSMRGTVLFGGVVAACDIGWFFLLGLAGVGLWVMFRKKNNAFCLPVTILTGLVLAFSVLEGNPRYHFPASALLCLCAAGIVLVPQKATK